MPMLSVILLLLLHVCGCILIFFLAVSRVLPLRVSIFPTVVLVPVFGPICALLLGIHKRRNAADADVQVDRFQVENSIYRSMGMMGEDENQAVVPLEEALILNSANTRRNLMIDMLKENVVPLEEALSIGSSDVRRKLMMDILTSDSSAFYSLLEQARLNDDVEVVHYATTAMSELGKKYDLMLQKCFKRHKENPDSLEALQQYCDCLRQYLNLGLVQGSIAAVRRKEYIAVLEKLTAQCPTGENYAELAQMQMENGAFDDADRTLCTLETQFPASESTWLLRLQFHVRQHHGAAVQRMVREAPDTGIYFSEKGREQIRFWSGETRTS